MYETQPHSVSEVDKLPLSVRIERFLVSGVLLDRDTYEDIFQLETPDILDCQIADIDTEVELHQRQRREYKDRVRHMEHLRELIRLT